MSSGKPILEHPTSAQLRAIARELPEFLTMQEDGVLKALTGITSLDEIIENAPRDTSPRPISEIKAISQDRRRDDGGRSTNRQLTGFRFRSWWRPMRSSFRLSQKWPFKVQEILSSDYADTRELDRLLSQDPAIVAALFDCEFRRLWGLAAGGKPEHGDPANRA